MSEFIHINGRVDGNDLWDVVRTGHAPIAGMPCPQTEDGRIHPHVTRFLMADGSRMSVVHVKPIYYETHIGKWRPMSEVASHYGNHKITLRSEWASLMRPRFLSWLIKRMELVGGEVLIPSPLSVGEHVRLDQTRILFTDTTVYPDPSPETTTVDGYAGRAGVTETWSTIRDSAGNDAGDNVTSSYASTLWSRSTSGDWRGIVRSIFGFDTSSIGADTASAATFSIYGSAKGDALSQSLVVDRNVPASATAVSSSDYNVANWDGSEQSSARISLASYSTSGYNDFSLNATGIGNINGSGLSWYGIRQNSDFDDIEPSWSANQQGYAFCYYADQTGTSSDPKLAITHEASGGGTNMQINIGDAWKTVDAMKINIGDTWKDVAAVKINVGDTWRDVF